VAASILGSDPAGLGERSGLGGSTDLPVALELPIAGSLTLAVDVGRLEREIERRLLEAMETVVPRRRGRPPRKERRGTR